MKPKRIRWYSRHDPCPSQLCELRRLFGPDVQIEHVPNLWATARDLVAQYRASGADDLVVIAPLSVLAALCEKGIRPLWPEMRQIDPRVHGEPDVTIQRRDRRIEHFRFTAFRRIRGIRIEYENEEHLWPPSPATPGS